MVVPSNIRASYGSAVHDPGQMSRLLKCQAGRSG
jgi:hypothetical protein